MKSEEIVFKKPVKVIQLFKKINKYGKDEKSFEVRKERLQWTSCMSKSGYLKQDKLFIPQNFLDTVNFNQCESMILCDDLSDSEKKISGEENKYFLPAHFWRFEIFELRKNLEIFLHYNEFDIGIPHRENFKFGTLKKESPLEIKINGKFDTTMTSGKQRTFKEQQFIIEYLGEFQQAYLLKEPFPPLKKIIPKERKLVDLIKTLW